MSHLLHPEYFSKIPFKGAALRQTFEALSEEASQEVSEYGELTVAIRTLNEAGRLALLLTDIKEQEYNGEIEIIVVDNESSGDTVAVAKKFGAKVLSFPREEFTYPRSMNLAMEAASTCNVFLTVGHAQLVSKQSLQAGYNRMRLDSVGGVYGHALPSDNASTIENIIAIGNVSFVNRRTHSTTGLGVMAATGAIFDREQWESLGGFNELYEQGGEDGELTQKIIDNGYSVVDEPLLSTHHTHGLNLINTVRQWSAWSKLGAPSRLDRHALMKRRPDLKLDDLK